jgi:hypothetical protein
MSACHGLSKISKLLQKRKQVKDFISLFIKLFQQASLNALSKYLMIRCLLPLLSFRIPPLFPPPIPLFPPLPLIFRPELQVGGLTYEKHYLTLSLTLTITAALLVRKFVPQLGFL